MSKIEVSIKVPGSRVKKTSFVGPQDDQSCILGGTLEEAFNATEPSLARPTRTLARMIIGVRGEEVWQEEDHGDVGAIYRAEQKFREAARELNEAWCEYSRLYDKEDA